MPGLLIHPLDDWLVILDTAVRAQTTRRHRLYTLGHVLYQRLLNLPSAFTPGFGVMNR